MSVETAELNPGFSCEEFYKALYAGAEGYIALCTRHPRCKKLYVNGFFSADEIEKLILQAKQLSGRYHVYHSVCTLKEVQKRGRGKKENYIGAMFFAVDVDAKDFIPDPQEREQAKKHGDNYQWDPGLLQECKKKALEKIHSLPFEPTAIIDSGHGYYPFYSLREFWMFDSQEERKLFEDLSRRLHLALGAFGTHDVTRVLRVVGTVNVKPGYPVQCRILEFNPDTRYNPCDLDDWLPPAEVQREYSPVILDMSTGRAEPVDIDKLDLPGYVLHAIKTGDSQGFKSKSERDQSIVYHLVMKGLSNEQILWVFETFPCGDKYREEEKKGNADNYFRRTLEKGHFLARQRNSKPEDRIYLYLPSGFSLESSGPGETLIITDVEDAATTIYRNGIPCVALAGLGSNSPRGFHQEDVQSLLQELSKLQINGHNFILILGSATSMGRAAWQAYTRFMEELYAQGADSVKMLVLPQLTSYLATHPFQEFRQMLDGAPMWIPSGEGAKSWAWERVNKILTNTGPSSSTGLSLSEETLEALAALRCFSELEYERAKNALCGLGFSKRALDSSVKQKTQEIKARQTPDPSFIKDLVCSVIPDAPVPPGARIPSGWKLDPSGIWRDSKEGPIRVTSTPVVISSRAIDLSSSFEHLELAYLRDGEWRKEMVPRGDLADSRRIVELANKGFPVTTENARELVKFIRAFEDENLNVLKASYVTHHMGWQGKDGKYGFLWGTQAIGGHNISFRGMDSGENQIALACHERGCFKEWLRIIGKVREFPGAVFGIYASLASPLLRIIDCDNFAIDWAGPSSTGKTTILIIAASVWSNPDQDASNGFIRSWDITQVALERTAAVLHNMPLILDDTKRAKFPEAVAKAIYEFASGSGRGRGTKTGINETLTWNSILLSTGETPATSFTNDEGTRGRTIVIWGSPFESTNKKDLVDEIRQGLMLNYGHAGPRFVEWIIAHKSEWGAWREQYQQLVTQYTEMLKGSPVLGRLATYLAAVGLAAKLAHAALPLPWEYSDPVIPIIDKIRGESDSTDKARKALELIYAWACAHETGFFGRHQLVMDYSGKLEAKVPVGGWLGKWDSGDNWNFIAFYPHVLKKALSDCGFLGEAEYDAIIRLWRDRGWLDTDPAKKEFARPTWDGAKGNSVRMIRIRREAIQSLS